jgi:hypothetical protein
MSQSDLLQNSPSGHMEIWPSRLGKGSLFVDVEDPSLAARLAAPASAASASASCSAGNFADKDDGQCY